MPDGDVFVHCGDFTRNRSDDLSDFRAWLDELPHAHKIVIAGNHDVAFERTPEFAISRLGEGVTYLQDSGIVIDGVSFWASPWQPEFNDWAFNLPRGAARARKWNLIPTDTDMLITHGPPMAVLDKVPGQDHLGCADLRKRVHEVSPRVHAFGHIHEGSGIEMRDGTQFVNASICDGRYRPVNPTRVVELCRLLKANEHGIRRILKERSVRTWAAIYGARESILASR